MDASPALHGRATGSALRRAQQTLEIYASIVHLNIEGRQGLNDLLMVLCFP